MKKICKDGLLNVGFLNIQQYRAQTFTPDNSDRCNNSYNGYNSSTLLP